MRILSALKFHKNTITNRDKAISELRDDYNSVATTPIVIFSVLILTSLLIGVATPFEILGIIISLLFVSALFYHWIIVMLFSHLSDKRRIKEEMAEEMRREKERAERLQRAYEQHREWQRFSDMLKQQKQREEEELLRRQHERRRRAWQQEREEQARRSYEYRHDYRQQRTQTVDQNMINAMKLMGLKEGFTQKDVKSAYRRLSKIHHPDVVGGSDVNFKKLNTAYKYIMERI